MNFAEILAEREFERCKSQHWFTDRLYDHSYMYRRMELHHQLHAHDGCVNAIAWDASGRWIVSGSDDCKLNIWRALEPYDMEKQHYMFCSLNTAHPTNIFACKFMNAANDNEVRYPPSEIISCSADGLVQWNRLMPNDLDFFDRETHRKTTSRSHVAVPLNAGFHCHTDMAFDVEPDPLNVNCFFSCSQDGTVNLYDLRLRSECRCDGCNRHTYIDVSSVPRLPSYRRQGSRWNHAQWSYLRRKAACKSDAGVIPGPDSESGRRGLFGGMFYGLTASSDVGITAMSLRQDNPVYMALACTDDMVRVYDRRYLMKPVYEVPESGRSTQDAVTERTDNKAVSIDSYLGIVYMFSPSHMRLKANRERERYERRAIVSGRRSNDLPADDAEEVVEQSVEASASEFRTPTDRFQEHYGQEYASLANVWVARANKITSLCYDPAGTGDLLISYSDEKLYVIRPTQIRPYIDGGLVAGEVEDESDKEVSPSRKRQRQCSLSDSMRRILQDTDMEDLSVMWPLYSDSLAAKYDRDIMSAYCGHRNAQTMIKEARFFHYPGLSSIKLHNASVHIDVHTCGSSAYVMSGSDDGHVFIWRKQYRANPDLPYPVVNCPDFLLKGDSRIVNCLQPHPFVPVLACSGIDNDVKLFMPTGGYGYEVDLFEDRERVRLEAIRVLAERNGGDGPPMSGVVEQLSSEEDENLIFEDDEDQPGARRLVVPASLLMRILGLTSANEEESEESE